MPLHCGVRRSSGCCMAVALLQHAQIPTLIERAGFPVVLAELRWAILPLLLLLPSHADFQHRHFHEKCFRRTRSLQQLMRREATACLLDCLASPDEDWGSEMKREQ